MNFKYITVFIFGCALITLPGCQIIRIYSLTKNVSYTQEPFEQNRPNADLKILFLGDSTAVGTGAPSNESVAGWFAQDFPGADIQNISHNGEKISGLLNDFPDLKEHFRLVVLQIGANDIMRLTRLRNVERQLSVAVDKSKAIGDYVIMLYSGDVGFAPIFIWPLDDIYSSRSCAFNEIYMRISHQKGAMYVDLMKKRQNDPFLKDIKKFYSPDRLHPSGQGYHHWYNEIRKTLHENGVIL